MDRTRLGLTLLAVAMATAVAAGALAKSPPSSGASPGGVAETQGDPIDVRADRMSVDLGARTARLEGNVKLRRGDLSLSMAVVDVRLDEAGGVRWAKGTGLVTLDQKGTHAESEAVEVDLARRSVELSGKVRVTRGASRLTAERATIDLASQRVSLSSVEGTLTASDVSSLPVAVPAPSP
jgi:lipopolysaccharide export system protein LptA